MGGERASTTRRREAGKICAICRTTIPWDFTTPRGERLCDRCAKEREKPVHKVYMRFVHRINGWVVEFLEADLTTRRAEVCYATGEKVMETAERGGAFKVLADRQAAEFAIYQGRGLICLNLTDDQYRKLK